MQKIVPFLWFDDQAEQAAKFYTSIFKNSKITHIARYPKSAEGATARPVGSVMTVNFTLAGERFTALNGGPVFTFNESISFVVNCDTQKEIDRLWTRLTSGGGKPSACGWLKDKFGVSWQIVPTALLDLIGSKDAAKTDRVMAAVLQMTKLDLAKLEAAAKGPAAAKPKRKTRR